MAGAFVAGATGYTGREVVAELRRRGVETFAHVRPDSPRLSQWRAHFEALGAQVDVTPWQESSLRQRFSHLAPRLVFALLGTTRARARQVQKQGGDAATQSYEAVDYGLSAMLMRAAAATDPHIRFVYLSALGVRPDPHAGKGYTGARARMEHELRESGLAYIVARPAFVSGEDRDESRPLERLAARTTDGLLDLAARLGATQFQENWHSLTGAELARALVSLSLSEDAERGTFGPAELRARA